MGLVERYELSVCLQCGKCTGGCAVSLRSPLNIRVLMREVLLEGEPGEVLSRPELWDCTTCAACTLRCPRGLEPSEFIVALRAELVEAGRVPREVAEALEATYLHGNPWGRARQKRTEWMGDIKVKVVPEEGKAEVLYFVGCAPSYDPRLQRIPRILCRVMEMAGLDFGVLGTRESCCGNEIRRMGEVGLFEELRNGNLESIRAAAPKWIVTTSPHCFNAFRKEYGLEGVEVLHFTELLQRLLREERISPSSEVRARVVYHDPCFLGKQNGIFDPPREVLRAIPGVELLEFGRARETSLCCEGGGGRMWVEGAGQGPRNGELRVREAEALGAEVIATACPFCLMNLEDALKTTGLEGKLQVMDVAELLAEALELEV